MTAVEWLNDKIIELDIDFECTLISRETYWAKRREVLEQAKQMEKQQIMKAYYDGHGLPANKTQQINYYNETYREQLKSK